MIASSARSAKVRVFLAIVVLFCSFNFVDVSLAQHNSNMFGSAFALRNVAKSVFLTGAHWGVLWQGTLKNFSCRSYKRHNAPKKFIFFNIIYIFLTFWVSITAGESEKWDVTSQSRRVQASPLKKQISSASIMTISCCLGVTIGGRMGLLFRSGRSWRHNPVSSGAVANCRWCLKRIHILKVLPLRKYSQRSRMTAGTTVTSRDTSTT